MQPVTLWYRFDVFEGTWAFNHLEDGHGRGERPVPPAGQVGWARASWSTSEAWLTDARPARVVYYSPDEAGPPGGGDSVLSG